MASEHQRTAEQLNTNVPSSLPKMPEGHRKLSADLCNHISLYTCQQHSQNSPSASHPLSYKAYTNLPLSNFASLYLTPIFRVRPEYARMETFTPTTDVEANIQNRERRYTRTPFQLQVLSFSQEVPLQKQMAGTSRNNTFDPG